jgi:hypothetical protein
MMKLLAIRLVELDSNWHRTAAICREMILRSRRYVSHLVHENGHGFLTIPTIWSCKVTLEIFVLKELKAKAAVIFNNPQNKNQLSLDSLGSKQL